MKNLNRHDRWTRLRRPIKYIFLSGLVISALSVYLSSSEENIGNAAFDNKDIKATQIPSPQRSSPRMLPSAPPAIAGKAVPQPSSPLQAADPQQSESAKIHIAFNTEWNFDHQYVEDSISYLQDGELPNVSMPRICWDEHGEYYSHGAVAIRGGSSYQCTYIGDMAGAPAFFWESI